MSSHRNKTLLDHIVRYLQKRVDYRDGWNNGDPDRNGEYWLLDRVLRDAKVVLDVGANVGEWSARCLQYNPSVELFAFEPSPATADSYARRFANYRNVHLLRYGLGNSDNTVDLCDYGDNSALSGYHSRELSVGYKPERIIQTQQRRLDGLDELRSLTHIDFVKIDTEGGEMNTLRGASALLENRKIDLIQFEYGGAWIDAREFLADAHHLLKGYGYSVGQLLSQGVYWIEKFDHRGMETFKYANFVACASRELASRLKLIN